MSTVGRSDDAVNDAVVEPLRRMTATPDDMRVARIGAGIEARLDAIARQPRRRWAPARMRVAALALAMLCVGAVAGATVAVRVRDRARVQQPPARVEPAPVAPARRAATRADADLVPPAPPSQPLPPPPPAQLPARAPAHQLAPGSAPPRASAEAVAAPRDEVEPAYAAAEQLMRIGASAEARAALLELVARHGDDPGAEPALIDLARLSASAGERDAASAFLREYLRRHPRGTFAAQAAARLRALDSGH